MNIKTINYFTASIILVLALSGCENKQEQPAGVSFKTMADALYAVMKADRTVYARDVINRLVNQEKAIKASEHWKDDKALPLPAQIFRLGAEQAAEDGATFSYGLLSEWPINKKNAPTNDIEKQGLKFISANPGQHFYADEKLGERQYFTAIYPDVAVTDACIECHNDHKDSPKTDFETGDIMGGVVIRIPM